MSRDLTVVGRALAAPARAAMLTLLMDGSRRPAGELAAAARVSAPTASEHLGVLVAAGLVRADAAGRRRWYRLADDSVARALETIGELCPPAEPVTYRQSREARDLARARLCYDHLAGRLGVALRDAFERDGWVASGADGVPLLTDAGRAGLATRDVAVPARSRRPLVRDCLDWTERRPHLAGALGAALAVTVLDRGWARRRERGRGLVVTPAGRAGFEAWGVAVG